MFAPLQGYVLSRGDLPQDWRLAREGDLPWAMFAPLQGFVLSVLQGYVLSRGDVPQNTATSREGAYL